MSVVIGGGGAIRLKKGDKKQIFCTAACWKILAIQ